MARDWFAKAFGATVDDIRKRLVEEPWFGREVTPPHDPGSSMAEKLGWERPGSLQSELPDSLVREVPDSSWTELPASSRRELPDSAWTERLDSSWSERFESSRLERAKEDHAPAQDLDLDR